MKNHSVLMKGGSEKISSSFILCAHDDGLKSFDHSFVLFLLKLFCMVLLRLFQAFASHDFGP